MKNWCRLDWYGLTAQMVLSFTVLVLLTAAAVGLPAILLVRNQVRQQAWSQVAFASQATDALFGERLHSTSNLATLVAQRPTLRRLLEEDATDLLASYLSNLQADVELDLLQVCDAAQQPLTPIEETSNENLCQLAQIPGYYPLSSGAGDQIWLLAADTISDESAIIGQVVGGIALDDLFLRNMRDQTGLEHTIVYNDHPIASSLPGGVLFWQGADSVREDIATDGLTQATEVVANGQRFYATLLNADPELVNIGKKLTGKPVRSTQLKWPF